MSFRRANRVNVSPSQIMEEVTKDLPFERLVELYPNYVNQNFRLYKTMELPSYVHGYSLAIEYMRNWFVQKFPKNNNTPTGTYFNTIYVNGSHVLDNWKNWNNYNIRREPPMLAIVPTLSPDYDRENIDMYMGDARIMLRASKLEDSFLKDYKNKIFLYLRLREMEMNFNFRIRVSTRSEQLDLFNKLELWFRVGTTQQDNISADFHIPYNIIIQIAKDAHFDINEENNTIVDIPAFVSYLNQHSSAPIIFKMRAINQKPEFFIRARNLYTHLAIRDKIQLDDGERSGKLNNNFHLDMNVQLHIPIPHFYAYMNQIPISDSIFVSEKKPSIGIYSINNYKVEPENELGWPYIIMTSYAAEKGEDSIDISPLFDSETWPVAKVLHEDLKLSISPSGFLDIKVFHNQEYAYMNGREANYHIDYKHMKIILDEEILDKGVMYEIFVYADMNYVNSRLATIESFNKRITSDQLSGTDIHSIDEQNRH
jgi:hypothetical protein